MLAAGPGRGQILCPTGQPASPWLDRVSAAGSSVAPLDGQLRVARPMGQGALLCHPHPKSCGVRVP